MKTASRIAAIAALVLVSGCRHAAGPPPVEVIPGLSGATKVYTLTNLRPNEKKAVLSAANFLQDGLIPVCSEVTLLTLNAKLLTFKVDSTGREYQYANHKSAAEGFPENLAKYFGKACPKKDLGTLTKQEREQVKIGQVTPGMRRRAVELAIGYPPTRTTPSLDADNWRYWTNRSNSFIVVFGTNGKVSRIQN